MTTSQDNAETSPHNVRDTKPINGKNRRHPSKLDGRTRAARRIKALHRQFMTVLGDVDPGVEVRVRALAEMTAEAEEWRATALRGEETDLAARVKLENVITRIRRELVLDRPRQKPAPTLAEYVARRAAA